MTDPSLLDEVKELRAELARVSAENERLRARMRGSRGATLRDVVGAEKTKEISDRWHAIEQAAARLRRQRRRSA